MRPPMPTIPIDHSRFGPCIELTHGDAFALVSLRGGQVLSWRTGGAERLFTAAGPASPGAAVRGGIPVIFPQFAEHGPGPRHGIARTALWTPFPVDADGDAAVAGLRLEAGPETLAAWPHEFTLELRVGLDARSLVLELRVHNPGPVPWSFAAALHTYLGVADGGAGLPAALSGHPFEDRSESGCRSPAAGPLELESEIERLYRDVPALLDWQLPERLELHSDGWPDLMVWNPGRAKAAALPDLAPGDHRRFLCVEPLRFDPVTLPADGHWRAWHRLRVAAP